ncbi:MAG: hypothetical protein JXR37_33685 [Kiritimatiellae bacterium]|nr:hypothetical protein [Kiritimatiellia bacterium]
MTGLRSARYGTVMLFVLAVAALVGCESSTTDEISITVDPSSATLIHGNGAVVFTAAAHSNAPTLFLPLEWSVSDSTLGRIESSAGVSAVYIGSGQLGTQAITVRDQGEAEGVAAVYQPKSEEETAGTTE